MSKIKSYYQKNIDQFKDQVRQYVSPKQEYLVNSLQEKDFYNTYSVKNIFQKNVLHKIYFNRLERTVNTNVVEKYRNLMNNSPEDIKSIFLRYFRHYLSQKKYKTELSHYMRTNNLPSTYKISQVKDYSVAYGVYRIKLSLAPKKYATLFLKQRKVTHNSAESLQNERIFMKVQNILENRKRHINPHFFKVDDETEGLISPRVPGISADSAISYFLQAEQQNILTRKKVIKIFHKIYRAIWKRSISCDLLGRNDRHLGNSNIYVQGKQWLPEESHKFLKLLAQNKDVCADWDWDISHLDCQYLLGENNYNWIFEDIRQGITEYNFCSYFLKGFAINIDQLDILEVAQWITDLYKEYCINQLILKERYSIIQEVLHQEYTGLERAEKLRILDLSYQKVFQKSYFSKIIRTLFIDYRVRLVWKSVLAPQETAFRLGVSASSSCSAFRRVISDQKCVPRQGDRIHWRNYIEKAKAKLSNEESLYINKSLQTVYRQWDKIRLCWNS